MLTHITHTNEINHLHAIPPNETNRPPAIHPNETVGAVPACPPERPRSGVSMPKTYALCAGMNDGCAPTGRHGRAHRHRPYPSPSYFSTQSAKRHQPSARNPPKRHQPSTRNPPNEMRRGGACVPARTSAQRRFHTKIYLRITYHTRGLNDGCAPAGRHGRAHRHRPYQSPLYIYTSGAEMHRALPPPFFKTSYVCKLASR